MAPLTVHIICNKANTYGLQEDITVLERLLKSIRDVSIQKPKVVDMREPLSHCDIQFHLEVPVFGAVIGAFTNILLVNPEQWVPAYDSYVHAFDVLLFRDPVSAEHFRADFTKKGMDAFCDRIHVVSWCDSWQLTSSMIASNEKTFGCFIGGSTNKYEYTKKVLAHWLPSDPPLTVYTSRADFAEGLQMLTNASSAQYITIVHQELTDAKQKERMASHAGLLICSQGESFGYAAAHAETLGSFAIMNQLPVFESNYKGTVGSAWLSNSYQDDTKPYAMASPTDNLRQELDRAFETFRTVDMDSIRAMRHHDAFGRFPTLCDKATPFFETIQRLVLARKPKKGIYYCPPILQIEDCPPISIITPTYNRKNLIEIAFHNLLATDYPQDKIEWVVIEDNEKTPHMASEKIIDFQIQVPGIRIKYIPIEGRMTIGEKRNHAIEHSTHDILLFMDDDDHYPSTSFRRRVAWLLKGMKHGVKGASIACCTTLALYDLKRGTSAVNVPPFDLPLSQRISEATLTFRREAWLTRKFPHVSVAEGENWIQGREDQVIEIPPQQIIVAFTHGANQSSRSVPPNEKSSCFWGFPKEYLMFIHGLVGVQVE